MGTGGLQYMDLKNIYYVLSSLGPHINLTTNLETDYYCPTFADKETAAQKGSVVAAQGHTESPRVTQEHTEPGSVPGLFIFNADTSQPVSQRPLSRIP